MSIVCKLLLRTIKYPLSYRRRQCDSVNTEKYASAQAKTLWNTRKGRQRDGVWVSEQYNNAQVKINQFRGVAAETNIGGKNDFKDMAISVLYKKVLEWMDSV